MLNGTDRIYHFSYRSTLCFDTNTDVPVKIGERRGEMREGKEREVSWRERGIGGGCSGQARESQEARGI